MLISSWLILSHVTQIGNGNLRFVSELFTTIQRTTFRLAALGLGCHRRSAAHVPSVPPYKDPNEGRRVISPGSR